MVKNDDVITIGDAPEYATVNSCGSAYCICRVGYPRGSIRLLPIGSGIPIPSDWLRVEKSLVDGMVLPDDPFAAMMRIAVRMAESGVYFRPEGYAAPEMSDAFNAEMALSMPRISYLNSIFVSSAASAPGEIGFSLSGKRFKPMIVSSNMSWATKAIFDKYVEAFVNLGIDFVSFEYDQFMKMFSEDIVRKILLSEVCDVDNGITHMIVIDGMSITRNIPETARKCGVETVLVTTEDPHNGDITRKLYGSYDHVFSNDKNMAEMLGVGYLPTASSVSSPINVEKDIDVLFVGAIYPNRLKFLSEVADSCLAAGLSLTVVGPQYKCRADGSLASRIRGNIVSTEECINLQSRARVCLNIFRDEKCSVTGANRELSIPAYSLSPRCYDVFMCGSMLLTDFRPEVLDIFGEGCLLGEDPAEKIVEVAKNFDIWKDIAGNYMKTVVEGHLYMHRAMSLLSCIGQGFHIEVL